MFPLHQRKLIRGCKEHLDAGLGCGADYVAKIGTELLSPFSGQLSIPYPYGGQGGNWLRLRRDSGDMIEFAHLSKFVKQSGSVQAGELIAYTGNTGTLTTGPHLHIQILRNSGRVDPDTYNWEEPVPPSQGGPMSDEDIAHKKYDSLCEFVFPKIGKPAHPTDPNAYRYIGDVAKREGKIWEDCVVIAFEEQYADEIKEFRGGGNYTPVAEMLYHKS